MSIPTPEFYFAFDGTMAPSIGTMTLRHYNAAGVEQTPAYTTGPFGQAVLCDTAGDYLESDEIAPWDIDTNDFWFELYITVIAATGELQLLSQRASSDGVTLFTSSSTSIHRLRLEENLGSNTTVNQSNWYTGDDPVGAGPQHYAGSFDRSSNGNLYINGVQRGTTAIDAVEGLSLTRTNSKIRIGALAGPTKNNMRFAVHKLRLGFGTLSQANVDAMYAETSDTNGASANPFRLGGGLCPCN